MTAVLALAAVALIATHVARGSGHTLAPLIAGMAVTLAGCVASIHVAASTTTVTTGYGPALTVAVLAAVAGSAMCTRLGDTEAHRRPARVPVVAW